MRLLQVPVPRGFSFYRLLVPSGPCDAAWTAVQKASSSLRLPRLLPEGSPLPPGLPVFSGTAYRSVLLLNGMAKALSDLAPNGARITLFDETGVLAKRVTCLAPFSRSLAAVTRRPERYAAAQRNLMARYGLSLPLYTEASKAVFACDVLLAPDAGAVPLGYAGLLFTLEKALLPNARVFLCGEVTLPPPYGALCPQGIESGRFAAALAERCHVRLPEDLAAEISRT